MQTTKAEYEFERSFEVGASNFETELDGFADRINQLIDTVRSGSEFARKCGVSEGVVRKWRLGESDPSRKRLLAITEAFDVSLIWLATGEGEMYLKAQPQQGHHHARSYALDTFDDGRKPAPLGGAGDDTEGSVPATLDDFALVPVYDVQASAGHGSHVESEPQTGHLAFRKDWLRDKGLKIKDLAIITAKGDSMEPTISDGDIMLVDTSIDKIIDDTIYIVQTDHHLIVKRIQQALDGSLTIISDNQRYERQKISPEQAKEVKITGRVKWYGHEI